jgi:hypothetical protein
MRHVSCPLAFLQLLSELLHFFLERFNVQLGNPLVTTTTKESTTSNSKVT